MVLIVSFQYLLRLNALLENIRLFELFLFVNCYSLLISQA